MEFRPIINIWILIPVFAAALVLVFIHIFRRNEKLKTNIASAVRVGLIIALAFVIMLRPSKEETSHDVFLSNLDVMFVVDDTISMWANDMNGTRMDEAKRDINYIMEELAGANFALITFDNYSEIRSPYTQDVDDVKDNIDSISVMDSYDATGTSMNTPYNDIESLLKSTAKKKNRQAIVFFISDGEITNDDKLMDFSSLKQYIKDGAVLGYGTEEGGTMQDEYGNYVYDKETNKKGISKIDEDNLKAIAKDLGISYIHVDNEHSADMRLSTIKSLAKSVATKQHLIYYTDYYWCFALPLIVLLVWEFIVVATKKRL
jgi:Ca-activated chloride channel family protein